MSRGYRTYDAGPSRPSRILRRLLRAPVYLYHWRCGRLLGQRFLLLIHIGRRTGRRRETILEVIQYREPGPEMVVMSGFGRDADWVLNITATPSLEVAVAGRHFVATYRVLDANEATAVVRNYEERHPLIAPLIRGVLSRLLGWPYQGTEGDRRRLVAALPLIAFRPQ